MNLSSDISDPHLTQSLDGEHDLPNDQTLSPLSASSSSSTQHNNVVLLTSPSPSLNLEDGLPSRSSSSSTSLSITSTPSCMKPCIQTLPATSGPSIGLQLSSLTAPYVEGAWGTIALSVGHRLQAMLDEVTLVTTEKDTPPITSLFSAQPHVLAHSQHVEPQTMLQIGDARFSSDSAMRQPTMPLSERYVSQVNLNIDFGLCSSLTPYISNTLIGCVMVLFILMITIIYYWSLNLNSNFLS